MAEFEPDGVVDIGERKLKTRFKKTSRRDGPAGEDFVAHLSGK